MEPTRKEDHPMSDNKQAKVREAVRALAASDLFIDLLVAELERAGAIH